MKSNNQQSADLRKKLICRLNQDGNNFDFSAFVKESGVDVRSAMSVAESVFVRFIDHVLEDGEITDRERRQLRNLAHRLQIDDDRRDKITKKVGTHTYRQQLRDSQADEGITKEERNELRELKAALGLARHSDGEAGHNESKLARVNASPEYAERNSAERHARLPKYHIVGKLVNWFLLFAIFGFGLLVCLMAAVAMYMGVAFIGIPFLLFGIFVIGLGCLCWWAWGRRLHQVDKTPVVANAAVVVDKRKEVSRRTYWHESSRGIGGDRHGVSVSALWWATFEDDQGNRQEYELFSTLQPKTYPGMVTAKMKNAREARFPLYEELTVGDAGVLYARGKIAFDFDHVC